MNKRPNATMSVAPSQQPPLPPGQPPAHDQAAIAAAWNQYYQAQAAAAAGGAALGMAQTAPQYANYGYGAGAPALTPAAGSATPGPAQPYAGAAGGAAGQPAYPQAQAYPAQPYPQHQQQQQQQPMYGMAPMGQPQPGMMGGYQQPYGQQPQAGGFAPHAAQQQQPYRLPGQPYVAPVQQQARPPMQQQQNRPGPVSGPGPAYPMTPNQTGGGFSPGGPGPMRPQRTGPIAGPGPVNAGFPGSPSGPPGNFPPAKRPRMDGPPSFASGPVQGGPRSGPGPVPNAGYGGPAPVIGGNFNPGMAGPSASRGGGGFGGPMSRGGGGPSMRGGPAMSRGGGPGMVDRGGFASGGPSSRGGRGGGFMAGPGSRVVSAGPGRGGAPISGRGAPRGRGGGMLASGPSTRGGASGAGAVGAPRGPKAQPNARNGKSTAATAAAPVPLTPEEEAKRKEKEKALEAEARKRTITDFRIIGLEIKAFDWSWGQIKEGLDADDFEEQQQLLNDDEEDEEEEELKHKRRREREEEDVAVEGVKVENAEVAAKPERTAEEDSFEVFDVVAGESVKAEEAEPKQDTADAPSAEQKETLTEEEAKKEDAAVAKVDESEEKRGAKRKAKMSSPEPDDDERILSKKRATGENGAAVHAPTVGDEAKTLPPSEKNRFRIYFASPVEKGDGPSVTIGGNVDAVGGEPPIEEVLAADGAGAEDEPSGAVQDGEDAPTPEEQDPAQEEEVQGEDDGDEENQADEAGAEAYLVEEHEDLSQENELAEQSAEGQQQETSTEVTEQAEPVQQVSASPSTDDAAAEPKEEASKKEEEEDSAADATASTAAAEAAKLAADLKASAENTSAAYGTRSATTKGKPHASEPKQRIFRRSPSLPPTSSDAPALPPNRLSILWGNGTRRLCLDAALVESVRIFRRRGYIQVIANLPGAGKQVTDQKDAFLGVLFEKFDEERNAFMPYVEGNDDEIPPLQAASEGQVVLTAFLDTDRPLSEPKWVKSGQMEDWIRSVRNGSTSTPARSQQALEKGWEKKLEVVDPDAPLTLNHVLEAWALHSRVAGLKDRRRFIHSSFGTVNDVSQILLRVVRGSESPLSRSQVSRLHGPLSKAIRPSSQHYTQQTATTLAIMAIVNLAKDYSYDAGEKSSALSARIGDIVKSLPSAVVNVALDTLFEESQRPAHGANGSDRKRAKK